MKYITNTYTWIRKWNLYEKTLENSSVLHFSVSFFHTPLIVIRFNRYWLNLRKKKSKQSIILIKKPKKERKYIHNSILMTNIRWKRNKRKQISLGMKLNKMATVVLNVAEVKKSFPLTEQTTNNSLTSFPWFAASSCNFNSFFVHSTTHIHTYINLTPSTLPSWKRNKQSMNAK